MNLPQWIECGMWVVTGASLIGTIANVKHKRWCFYVWAVTNALWAAYDVHKTAYPQAALQSVYFGLAIWGIFEWRKGNTTT